MGIESHDWLLLVDFQTIWNRTGTSYPATIVHVGRLWPWLGGVRLRFWVPLGMWLGLGLGVAVGLGLGRLEAFVLEVRLWPWPPPPDLLFSSQFPALLLRTPSWLGWGLGVAVGLGLGMLKVRM